MLPYYITPHFLSARTSECAGALLIFLWFIIYKTVTKTSLSCTSRLHILVHFSLFCENVIEYNDKM